MSANAGLPAQEALRDDGLDAYEIVLVRENGSDSSRAIADMAYFGILGAVWIRILMPEADPWELFPDESTASEAMAAAIIVGGAAAIAAIEDDDEAFNALMQWANLKNRFKVNAIVLLKNLTKIYVTRMYAKHAKKNYPTLSFALTDIVSDCRKAREIAERIAGGGYLSKIIEENEDLRRALWPENCQLPEKTERLVDVVAKDIGRLVVEYKIKKVTFDLVQNPRAFKDRLFEPIKGGRDDIKEEVDIEPRLLLILYK